MVDKPGIIYSFTLTSFRELLPVLPMQSCTTYAQQDHATIRLMNSTGIQYKTLQQSSLREPDGAIFLLEDQKWSKRQVQPQRSRTAVKTASCLPPCADAVRLLLHPPVLRSLVLAVAHHRYRPFLQTYMMLTRCGGVTTLKHDYRLLSSLLYFIQQAC